MLVTPYGDPEAHGTISKTLTFIRRRGIIYARPYKVPKDPRSAGQIAQRQLFFDAVASWHTLSSTTQDYFNAAATGQSYTGFNLYISRYMLGTLPSTTPLIMLHILDAVIAVVRSPVWNGWRFRFQALSPQVQLGMIRDNQNIWNDDLTVLSSTGTIVTVAENTETINVHFRDTVTIDYDLVTNFVIYFPAVIIETHLYLADDGSTYYDLAMTQLACGATV